MREGSVPSPLPITTALLWIRNVASKITEGPDRPGAHMCHIHQGGPSAPINHKAAGFLRMWMVRRLYHG